MNYQNCFIGVPIPEEFRTQLQEIKLKIRLTAPHFKPSSATNPHITLLFFGDIDSKNFPTITKAIEIHKKLLKNIQVTVHTIGYFTPTRPRVVFLQVDSPPDMQLFLKNVSQELSPIITRQERDKTFAPHLTLGRNTTRNTQKAFHESEKEVAEIVQSVNWKINLNEVVLYARNPESPVKIQEKIATITL